MKWMVILLSLNQDNQRISGFDTETVRGYARICATEDEVWQTHSFNDIVIHLFTLLRHGRIQRRLFTYNMNFDFQAIIKYLYKEELQMIADNGATGVIIRDRWKVKFIPGRFASINDLTQKGREISFYDLAQFYNYAGLDKSSEDYLNKRKYESETTEFFKVFENTDEFLWHNKDELMSYCKADAYLASELGKFFDRKVFEVYDIHLRIFPSNAAIAEMMSTKPTDKTKFPYPKIVHEESHQYAEAAYHGGWFEVTKVGSFKDVTDIDISSAYPSTMVKLPHWGNGQFAHIGVDACNKLRDSDYYGWVLCEFDCPYIPYNGSDTYTWDEIQVGHDIKVSATNPKKYYPTGKRIQIITLIEYRFLKKWNYYVKMHDGYVWRKYQDKYRKPFHWVMDAYKVKKDLVKKYTKKVAKKMMEYTLSKIGMNGGYGKTVQRVGVHKMQNFYYGSYITAECRVQVADMVLSKGLEDLLIMVATDGALFDGHIEFTSEELGEGLGSWDVDYYDSALVLASGLYQLGKGEEIKTALRGINKDLKYNLRALLEKHRNKNQIVPNSKERPVGLKMALNYVNIFTKEDINVFHQWVRKINLNTDKKLKWNNLNCFGDLLDGNFSGERFSVQELEDIASKKDKVQKTLNEYN